MKKTAIITLVFLTLFALFTACNTSTFRIDVTGEHDLLMEQPPQKAGAGDTVQIKTHVIDDADIVVKVNGETIEKTHSDSDYWGFTFTMPDEDVILSLETIDGFGVLPRLTDFLPWLKTLTADSISEIRIVSSHSGVTPGTLKKHLYTEDRTAIERLVETYQEITLEKSNEVPPPGVLTRVIRFVLSDGTVREIVSLNGVFTDNQNFFTMITEPTFTESEASGSAFSFVTYQESCEVYTTHDEALIGHFKDLDSLTFTRHEGDVTDHSPEYRIVTDFGELFVLGERLFYIQSQDTNTYYSLTNGNFYTLLSFPE